jgi:hypothetical protein
VKWAKPVEVRSMEGLGRTVVPARKTLNVFNVCFSRDSQAGRFEPAHAELHSIEGHNFGSLLVNVINELRELEDSARHFGLELCLARKDDNRRNDFGR